MVGKTDAPTKRQQQYQDDLRNTGCVCCRMLGGWRQAEIHHIVEGRKRLGHDFVVPLCDWHHRQVPPNDMTVKQAAGVLGPSLAGGKKPFVKRWGTEKELQLMAEEFAQQLAKDQQGMPF